MSDPINGSPEISWRDDLVTLTFSPADATALLEGLKELVRRCTHLSGRLAMESMARASRMCYEVNEEGCLRDLSREDVLVLNGLRETTELGFIHKVLTNFGQSVRLSGVDDTMDGHRMAKDIHYIMTC